MGEYQGQATLDRAFHALSDSTRRAILERLTSGKARVTEIAEPFTISLNSVSKHIKVLEEAKLITRTKVGREHFIQVEKNSLRMASEWISRQQAMWAAALSAIDEHIKESHNT